MLFILKNVVPVVANLSKAFQAGSVLFSQIVPLASTTKATLEEILKTNSPVDKFESAFDSYNMCEDIKINTAEKQQLYKLQENYISCMTENIEA